MGNSKHALATDLVPLHDAARELGMPWKQLYNRCRENAVEAYRYLKPGGERGRWSIPRSEIERLKAEAIQPRIIGRVKKTKRR